MGHRFSDPAVPRASSIPPGAGPRRRGVPLGDEDEASQVRDRFRGALLGAAVGAALGAVTRPAQDRDRGSASSEADAAALETSRRPALLALTSGTRLMLATARALVEARGFHGERMAEALAAEQGRMAEGVTSLEPPEEPARSRGSEGRADPARPASDGSFGHGAALRAAPLGLLHQGDPERAGEVARLVARITHQHPVGQDGAALQACTVAYLVRHPAGEALDTSALLEALRPLVWTRRFQDELDALESLDESATPAEVVQALGHGVEAHRSVATALYAFLRHPGSFESALLFSTSLGGEAGAIGTMTGALAGAFLGEEGIAETWLSALEGRDEIAGTAERLFDLVASRC